MRTTIIIVTYHVDVVRVLRNRRVLPYLVLLRRGGALLSSPLNNDDVLNVAGPTEAAEDATLLYTLQNMAKNKTILRYSSSKFPRAHHTLLCTYT